MYKISYNRLSQILSKIIKKYKYNKIIFNIPYLHFVKGHPKFSFIYPEVFSDKNFSNREDYNFFKKIKKNLNYFKDLPNKKNYKKLLKKDAIIISNLINKKNYLSKSDIYTNDLKIILDREKISNLKIYRNFTDETFSCDSNKFVLSRLNFFWWELITILKILLESIKIKLIKLIKFNKNNELNKIENYFFDKSTNYINLFGALTTLRIEKQIEDTINIVRPKILFLPIEGHIWEKSLIKCIKLKFKNIKIIGIQFSTILDNDHTIKKNYGKIYEPHLIICNNYINYLTVKKKKLFKNSKIIYNNLILKKVKLQKVKTFNKFNCLVVPELNIVEVNKFITLIKKIKFHNNKINFTLKLHPQTKAENFVKIKKELKNISKVSRKKLDTELKKNNILIYRGSTACFKAAQRGLWLLYHNTDKYDINPLKGLKLKKNYFLNDIEFCRIINYLHLKKKHKLNKLLNSKNNQNFLDEDKK